MSLLKHEPSAHSPCAKTMLALPAITFHSSVDATALLCAVVTSICLAGSPCRAIHLDSAVSAAE